jgi:hypothetical protein
MALRKSTSAVLPLERSRAVVKPDIRSNRALIDARIVMYGAENGVPGIISAGTMASAPLPG